MAPQTHIPISANVLGTIGTVCWCVQLLPQIWRNHRTKSTVGLPATMMFLWSISGVPFGIYAIVQKFNIALQVQPQCFSLFCGVSWCQCLIYGRKWRQRNAYILLIVLLALFAGIQVGLVFAIRPAYAHGTSWPVIFIGIIAFILMISAFLPIPLELMKRRGRIVGIDFVFLAIDWCGAFFSLLSLAVQEEFDVMFGIMYALCCTIEMSMVVSHLVWMVRTRKLRQRAREAGCAFDDWPEAVEWEGRGIDLEARFRDLIGRQKEVCEVEEVEATIEADEEKRTVPKAM
ncbi:PQ loop repeat protein-like protein [Polyplosphaeria fusca]|uniref:PQ loop repeat protein-like protein n=1 Tax=Polyplosphaeria fusca TaxID=682080 RepID=A0A9P4QSW4_9PLEO|nr:PQ loop repeat protein-like protein [Polyplosphaeria fusca]